MALHGSACANLSPILFKGNNRALGLNIIIHQDDSISVDDVNQFYSDGTFIEKLQNALLSEKIGSDINSYPNLYAFYTSYGRNYSTPFSISNSNGSLLISQAFMRGESTGSETKTNWTNKYVKNESTHYIDICTNKIGETQPTRKIPDTSSKVTSTLNPSLSYTDYLGTPLDPLNRLAPPYAVVPEYAWGSEDLHGCLWSIYTTPNAVSTGVPGRFGSVIGSPVRTGTRTIIIINSDEQERVPEDMLNIPVYVETKEEVFDTVCICVIDETSPSEEIIRNAWISFRQKYRNRPFYLLRPATLQSNNLNIPQEFRDDPLAFGPIDVSVDNGDVTKRSDWFSICNLDNVTPGKLVAISIDTSESTNIQTIRASLNYFNERCKQKGLPTLERQFSDEVWSRSHDVPYRNYTTRVINGSDGEISYRNYTIISLNDYTSTDGFDGILFYNPNTTDKRYGYVKFTSPTTYTITPSSVAPNWDKTGPQPGKFTYDENHEMIPLARDTFGAVFKIRRVFLNGAIIDNRQAFISCIVDFITTNV